MRNLKMALVVLAVLAMASTSFADWSISVTPLAAPAPGLSAYLVHTTGANAFTPINIVGNAHQVSKVVDEWGTLTVTPTLFDSDLGTAPALFHNADTHFLFANDLAVGAGAMSEGNDMSNPAPLSGLAGDWKAGMGFFGTKPGGPGMTFSLKGAAASAALQGLDFMRIVLPTNTMVNLTGGAVDYYNGEVIRSFNVQVGAVIPEPGTIVLLIAGALCLVVARFRK